MNTMNKFRLLGLGLLVLCVVLATASDRAAIDFIAGCIGSAGLVWLIIGRLKIRTSK